MKTLVISLSCNIVAVGVETNWFLIAERYRNYLCSIFNKIILDHLSAPPTLFTNYANLVMFYTAELKDFKPAILLFDA